MSSFDLQTADNSRSRWASENMVSQDQIEPTLFQGAWKPVALAAPRAVAQATRILGMAYASPLAVIDQTFGTEYADPIFRAIDKYPKSWVNQLTPNPRTIGTAGRVLGAVTEGGMELLAGGGNPTVLMAMQGNESAQNVIDQGGSVKAAYGVGAINAAAAGLGVKVAPFGPNLATRLLTGMGGNVALGSATRGATSAILKADGQKEAADQYHAFGGTDMMVDAFLGSVFAAHPEVSAAVRSALLRRAIRRGLMPSEVDAAMALKNAQHFQEDSAPGKPTDVQTFANHQDALESALRSLSAGKPVDVADTGIQHGNFEAKDLPEITPVPEEMAPNVSRETLSDNLANIPRDSSLSAADSVIESNSINRIQRDPNAALEAYNKIAESAGGKIKNTDIARELFPEYQADRTKSAAVHEAASAITKESYARSLKEQPKPGEEPLVVFSAGGTGAGKTTGIDLTGIANKAQIIYDSNMNSMESSVKRIDQALEAGKKVQILYTYRHPVDAFTNGALSRARNQEGKLGSGRTVRVNEHAKTHIGASKVVRQLAEHYANDPRVDIKVVDNSHGKGGAKVSDLSLVPKVDMAHTELVGKLHEILDQQFKAGKISESIYKGFKGEAVQPEGIRADVSGTSGKQDQSKLDIPELATSHDLVQQYPDAKVEYGFDNEGAATKTTAAEAYAQITAEHAQAVKESSAYQAAVTCFLGSVA